MPPGQFLNRLMLCYHQRAMEEFEKEVKKQLKKHLKGVGGSTIENLVKRMGGLPYERVLLTTDIGASLAATNLRAAVEMLKAAPEVSRLIDAADARVWGEVGKRLSATSGDSAANFFQDSARVLEAIPEDMRSPVLWGALSLALWLLFTQLFGFGILGIPTQFHRLKTNSCHRRANLRLADDGRHITHARFFIGNRHLRFQHAFEFQQCLFQPPRIVVIRQPFDDQFCFTGRHAVPCPLDARNHIGQP